MKIVDVSDKDQEKIRSFLETLGTGSESFRYFEKRPISIIKNHLVTLLLEDDHQVPLAYGHIETEKGINWLGIAVSEDSKGKGLGKIMLRALLEAAYKKGVQEIHLSVDTENQAAQNLYRKYHFREIRETNRYKIFNLNLDEYFILHP